MLKKYISVVLAIVVLNLGLGITSFANDTREDKEIKSAMKVKSEIAKIGVGNNSKIEVKLKDGTKIKGHVGEIKESTFVMVDESSNVKAELPYSQVNKAKGISSNNKGRIFVIAFLVVVVVVVAVGGGNR